MSRPQRFRRKMPRRGNGRRGRSDAGIRTPAGGETAAAKIPAAQVAEEIALAALRLADRARGAGLSSLGHILETAALEASADAAARRWPSDVATSAGTAGNAPAK
jgi:hypothetical protein